MNVRLLTRLSLTVLVAGIFMLLALGSSDSGGGGTSSTSFPQVGEEGRVHIEDLDNPLLAADKAAFDQWVSVCAAGDQQGAAQMHASGRMFAIKNNTRVKVIDIAFGALQVRVLEGDRTGSSGWISHEFVKRI